MTEFRLCNKSNMYVLFKLSMLFRHINSVSHGFYLKFYFRWSKTIVVFVADDEKKSIQKFKQFQAFLVVCSRLQLV